MLSSVDLLRSLTVSDSGSGSQIHRLSTYTQSLGVFLLQLMHELQARLVGRRVVRFLDFDLLHPSCWAVPHDVSHSSMDRVGFPYCARLVFDVAGTDFTIPPGAMGELVHVTRNLAPRLSQRSSAILRMIQELEAPDHAITREILDRASARQSQIAAEIRALAADYHAVRGLSAILENPHYIPWPELARHGDIDHRQVDQIRRLFDVLRSRPRSNFYDALNTGTWLTATDHRGLYPVLASSTRIVTDQGKQFLSRRIQKPPDEITQAVGPRYLTFAASAYAYANGDSETLLNITNVASRQTASVNASFGEFLAARAHRTGRTAEDPHAMLDSEDFRRLADAFAEWRRGAIAPVLNFYEEFVVTDAQRFRLFVEALPKQVMPASLEGPVEPQISADTPYSIGSPDTPDRDVLTANLMLIARHDAALARDVEGGVADMIAHDLTDTPQGRSVVGRITGYSDRLFEIRHDRLLDRLSVAWRHSVDSIISLLTAARTWLVHVVDDKHKDGPVEVRVNGIACTKPELFLRDPAGQWLEALGANWEVISFAAGGSSVILEMRGWELPPDILVELPTAVYRDAIGATSGFWATTTTHPFVEFVIETALRKAGERLAIGMHRDAQGEQESAT